MPSFRTTVLAIATSFAAFASADYVIDPESVPLSIRQSWCANEIDICPAICRETSDASTKVNECNPKTLNYGCICGDGKQPNVSEYSLTLPYFVCSEWGNQCVADCNGDNACQSSCRQDHPCGATNPKRYNATKTATKTGASATASATDDDSVIYTDVSGGDDSDSDSDSDSSSSKSSDKSGAGVALEVGQTWGLAIVLGSMFAGFAML